ncbi:MAG: hypothetical protein IJM54_01525 [Thermoguttaceae bacterium]|nr:hypothetical protein [Thermoguttaceae bacterium]
MMKEMEYDKLFKIFAIIRAISVLRGEDMPENYLGDHEYALDTLDIMMLYLRDGVNNKEEEKDLEANYEEFVERYVKKINGLKSSCDKFAEEILSNLYAWQNQF